MYTSVVEHLPSMFKGLGSVPSVENIYIHTPVYMCVCIHREKETIENNFTKVLNPHLFLQTKIVNVFICLVQEILSALSLETVNSLMEKTIK